VREETVMPATTTETPNVFADTGIIADDDAVPGRLVDGETELRDLTQPDAITAAVGERPYLSPHAVTVDDELVLEFERFYPALEGEGKPVYVDTVSGGVERERQEAERAGAAKRAWCKKQGATYRLIVEDELTV
jgi:hypothetical protein